jgi:hypothetical protein
VITLLLKTKYFNRLIFSVVFLAMITIAGAGYPETINVGTVNELKNAIAYANSSGGSKTILLQDGTYSLIDTLYVNASNVTVAGLSGAREKVVIQGDAMSNSAKVGNIFRVAGSNFEIRDVTIQKCRWHIIQIVGESNADYPVIKNCVLRDSYQQMLKVTLDSRNASVTSDNGLVENCIFEYSAGIGPQYYIGGIDGHGVKNWIVRNNTFRSIISPGGGVAEFAVHLWNGSANNTVEKNLIVNCDRGIGFGMDGCGNTGGIIRNNMIYHAANKGQFADTGIALTESPDSKVYNNSIFMQNDFPWAIEYRFNSTRNVLIANNLTNKAIQIRDGATGTVTSNVTNAAASWFVSVSGGELHLASAIGAVVDVGQAISGLSDDFDGQSRPQGSGFDIGADEFAVNADDALSQAPKNLRIVNP